MRFAYPWLLAFLPVVPLFAMLALWLIYRGKKRLAIFISPVMQQRLVASGSHTIPTVQVLLAATGLALLVVASARPQWGRSDIAVKTKGRNLLIALDVSRSMLASDVHPNRLERAKVDIMDLIADLRGDRAGILVFRGRANMLCPLTTDRAFLRQTLDGISIDSAPRGETDLADAITKSIAAFETTPDENNAVILISDGEDLAGKAVKVAEKAGASGIPIFTVGIGDPKGADVPSADGKGSMKHQGKKVRSKLEEATLEAIAKASGGVYIPLATSGTASTTLGAIYRQHLSRIAAKELEEMLERRLVERYQLFLIPGLLFFAAAAALSRGRLASDLRRSGGTAHKSASAVLVALMLLPAIVLSDSVTNTVSTNSVPAYDSALGATGVSGARKAQSLFKKGKYTESAEAYLHALLGQNDVEQANRYRYNAGVASYKADDLAGAVTELYPLIALPGFGGAAELYGAAQFKIASGSAAATNANAKSEALSLSAAGFQQALRARPDDGRLRRNLARSVENIPALRDAAHLESVLAEHGKTPPQQLLDTMLSEQRAICKEAEPLYTNENASVTISGLEALAERQRAAADLWIPLKSVLIDSGMITNEQQRAIIAQEIESTRDAMQLGATQLDDISSEAFPPLFRSEESVYSFWKGVAEPPALIGEDILAQTNSYISPGKSRYQARDDWQDALELTERFSATFPKWAEQVIQQRAADTNQPPFTAEAAAEIVKLAGQLQWLQKDAIEHSGTDQRKGAALDALKLLEQIRELLPKNKNQSQPNQQPNQQPQQKQEQKQEEQQPQQSKDDEKQQEEQPKEAERKEAPPDVQESLRRVLEREKEHDKEKARQMREYPMAPSARDW